MTEELKKFISSYVTLSDTELDNIAGRFTSKSVKKKEYLLREGQVCKDLIFVQQGCPHSSLIVLMC